LISVSVDYDIYDIIIVDKKSLSMIEEQIATSSLRVHTLKIVA